jgi:hypothetical protein
LVANKIPFPENCPQSNPVIFAPEAGDSATLPVILEIIAIVKAVFATIENSLSMDNVTSDDGT